MCRSGSAGAISGLGGPKTWTTSCWFWSMRLSQCGFKKGEISRENDHPGHWLWFLWPVIVWSLQQVIDLYLWWSSYGPFVGHHVVPLVDHHGVPMVYCQLTGRVSPFTSHWLVHQMGDLVVLLVGHRLVPLGRPSTGDSHSPSAGASVVPRLVPWMCHWQAPLMAGLRVFWCMMAVFSCFFVC